MSMASVCFLLGILLTKARQEVRLLKQSLIASKKKEEALLLITKQSKDLKKTVEKAKKIVREGDEEAINQLYRDILAGRI